ncbi:phosphoglycerate kinase [Coemansia sp. RSA 1878]|nr:phosphoglycerate kinase [Coemansia sp. RSA 1878]
MSITNKLFIKDVDVKNKRVLVRVNLNVPIDSNLRIVNKTQIMAAVPMIKYLQEQGASGIVLMSHLGRPNGQVVEKYSLKPVANELQEQLGQTVTFLSDCVGAKVENACADLTGGQVALLENLRFHIEEEGSAKDSEGNIITKAELSKVKEFRESLTKLGDIYVNDALDAASNAYSSVVGVDLPVCAAGFFMHRELEYFGKLMENPTRPYLAIVGGSRLSDKVQLIDSLLDKVDKMIVTGGIACTFHKVLSGMDIGNSIYDSKGAESVQKLVDKAKDRGVTFVLPTDFVTGDEYSSKANTGHATVQEGIPKGWHGLDIGPESVNQFEDMISSSKTIVWCGPCGVYQYEPFAKGTYTTMCAIADAHQRGATTIIAGYETAEIASKYGITYKFSYVSKSSGSSLGLLMGKELPGVAALSTK